MGNFIKIPILKEGCPRNFHVNKELVFGVEESPHHRGCGVYLMNGMVVPTFLDYDEVLSLVDPFGYDPDDR